jgi:O-antigen/teichoic acid export membrane protein
MLPLAVVCAAVAPWVVPLLFGDVFERSVPVLQILLISLLASVVPVLLSPYFFGQLQRPGLASTTAWVRVLLALGLTLALAPALAEIGVALGVAIADVCATLLILVVYVRIGGKPIGSGLFPRREDVPWLIYNSSTLKVLREVRDGAATNSSDSRTFSS